MAGFIALMPWLLAFQLRLTAAQRLDWGLCCNCCTRRGRAIGKVETVNNPAWNRDNKCQARRNRGCRRYNRERSEIPVNGSADLRKRFAPDAFFPLAVAAIARDTAAVGEGGDHLSNSAARRG